MISLLIEEMKIKKEMKEMINSYSNILYIDLSFHPKYFYSLLVNHFLIFIKKR
jgi:hypothetical protein